MLCAEKRSSHARIVTCYLLTLHYHELPCLPYLVFHEELCWHLFYFVLYNINDLHSVVKCKIRMYADDTLIYNTIHNISNCFQLQNDISELAKIW